MVGGARKHEDRLERVLCVNCCVCRWFDCAPAGITVVKLTGQHAWVILFGRLLTMLLPDLVIAGVVSVEVCRGETEYTTVELYNTVATEFFFSTVRIVSSPIPHVIGLHVPAIEVIVHAV